MKTIVNIILALFLMVVAVIKSYNTEGFDSTSTVTITSATISDYIYRVYRVDVNALQNLADIAVYLQTDGITYPGNFTISDQLNVAGNTIMGTLTSGAITSPTITDLYAKITALETGCTALENNLSALTNKTSALSNDGTSAAFSGNLSVSGATTFNVTIFNNSVTFNSGTINFMTGDVRFDSGPPFFREVDGDRNQWYKVTGPANGRDKGISATQYNANFVYFDWRDVGCCISHTFYTGNETANKVLDVLTYNIPSWFGF